ncbi:SIK3 isoform 13, partial [Pan troglodytes]
NSDDAYVQLDNLPGMSLVAGKALSSARMSDAVLSQSSLMGSQQFQDGENEDILLSYKHPEVSFSMEQAGV